MPDNEKTPEVRHGQHLTAATVNSLIKKVDGLLAPTVSATAATLRTSPGTNDNLITIRNDTGEQLFQTSIISLQTISNPSKEGDTRRVFDEPLFVATKPVNDLPIAVMVEPVRPGGIGLAMVYGVYQAKIMMSEQSHRFGVIVEGDCTHLESAESGPFTLLFRTTPDATAKGLCHSFIHFPSAPIVASGSTGGGGYHHHADNSYAQKGYSFAVYHPGCSTPQMPFE